MYVCYGNSMKSEKDAFNKAMEMLFLMDIKLKSVRLDRRQSHGTENILCDGGGSPHALAVGRMSQILAGSPDTVQLDF